MASLLKKNGKLRLPLIFSVLGLLLVLGLAGGKWIVWPKVKVWREQRTNNVAREKIAQGDLASAMTAVRTSLRYNQFNLDAWNLGLEITEKQKSPDQYYFLQRIAQLQPTLENKLKFIHFAVDKGAYPQAQEVIAKVGQEGAASAEFLELAASVAQHMNNPTKAKYYLMSLVSLRPNDNLARFDLAQLRLVEGFSENRPAIRNEIRSMVSDPALHTRALALLLADSIEQKSANEALEYADQLSTTIGITPQQQILIAEAYRQFAPGKLDPYINQLKQSYTESPEKVIILASFLINLQRFTEVCLWIESLPEKTKTIENVQVTEAYALLQQKKWDELETFLRACKWKEAEFTRHAMLAYKHRNTDSERLFNEEWQLAVIEVGNNQRKLQSLLSRTIAWNWPTERNELLWKRFSIDPNDETTRQQLIGWEGSRGNTANLNKLFARIVETSPNDKDAKNNFAYTSLLLGTNLDRAAEIARDLNRIDPKNPFFLTTLSLSLYKQGKPQQALETINSVSVAGLSQPERTVLRALYLIESEKIQEGADLLANIRPNMLALPEERRLYDNAQALVAKSQREQGNIAHLASLNAANTTPNVDRKSWIAILPETFRKPASVPMELADTFYASDDYRGLESTLKGDRWEQNDFLRLALLAYAQRNQGRESDAHASWRTALASAGGNTNNLTALTEMCERWSWSQERIELYGRIYQRDPLNQKVFVDLADYYTKAGQTAELAHIYELRCDASPGDLEAKSRFAYYSLLVNSNLSHAHVTAREAYDAAPNDAFRAKVYAFSLFKQSRAGDAWRVIEKIPDRKETGLAQIGLIKAIVVTERKDYQLAKSCLEQFDASTALPEETNLADTLTQSLAKKDT